MSAFSIRCADPNDATTLAEFAARTFSDTFASLNTADDMAAHLRSAYSTAQQQSEIESARADRRESASARLRGVPPSRTIELWRFYVDKSEIASGAAHALMAAVLEEAQKRGAQTVWLGVWEHNLRAIAFYRKHRFRDIGNHVFRLGNDVQTDLIFFRPLAA